MTERIVVGVDGSEGAGKALRWAAEEAKRRGAALELVHVWSYPALVDLQAMAAAALAEAAEATGREVLASAAEQARRLGVNDVDERLVAGGAAAALTEQAKGADLLVVGGRGRGGFAGLLLGSVSQQCVHHAPCPVVVVP